jgi:SnoaL-like protein
VSSISAASTTELADIVEIQRVLYRYAIAIDTRQLDLLDTCFTPDADLEMSIAGKYESPAAYKAKARDALAQLDATHHSMSAPLIEVDGDHATAHTYYHAQHARNALAPNALFMIGGWIDDELARVDGQWLITKRRGQAVWFDGNPAVLGLDVVPGANPDLRLP